MRASQLRGALTSSAITMAAVLVAGQQTDQPGRFRSGTNVIRVDATVVDRTGNPVPTLTADDFEVREDGALQKISSFKFVSADGQPTDDRSLPIRSQAHAAAEAARDDVRTFLIFWDEYHIGEFVSSLRAREAMQKAVMEAFGPTDLVALMDQLTPVSAIEFTRERRQMADQIHKLKGRRGVYFPPRSAAEEAHLQVVRQLGQVEILRNQVTVTAIKAAAAHLGTFGEGRKTLLIVTEGIRFSSPSSDLSEESNVALDIARTANDSNVAIHIIDPRGLQTTGFRQSMALDTLTQETGGQVHRGNDLSAPFTKAVKEASAVYLLGYTREMPMDGKFHQIKVRVRQRGFEVRARSGYWAPHAVDVDRAKTAAAAAVLPPEVANAFAALTPSGAPRLLDIWTGTKPLPDGRMQVTLAWTRRSANSAGSDTARRVTVVAKSPEVVFDGEVAASGTTFEAPARELNLAFTIFSDDGQVVDRETRTLAPAAPSSTTFSISAPAVYRAANPTELRAILDPNGNVPIYAGRDFVRTDRLFVRFSISGAPPDSTTVTAHLLDRRGATLVAVPVQRATESDAYQIDLPLASIAAGEFAIAIDAVSGADRVRAMVPLRVAVPR